ncbi:major facilitator superfamily domain-containing protein 8 isoform X2 [Cylas formicarius]|nr:major facilitator superfamily domain-containing protein 8 isoform X2 [Cylas formicarius]XP_060524431.1 major facilitator superfamily domain-containing protein 8 isoform X2 [Cylas formicarius]
MAWYEKVRLLIKDSRSPKTKDNLETPEEYKERWISIYIIYFTMFMISLGFSIIVTGVWPYLDKLDPTAGKEYMGFVVAANPFAQMLFSPLVGWWTNKAGSIRIPVIVSLVIFTLASGLYSSLELFETNRKHWMLWSRFLVGVSSANVAACRSYLSAATRYSERTKAVSMISLAQVLGFVIGPAIQAAVVPLGDDGLWIIPNRLKLNMYTASGWINAALSLINIFLFLPKYFKEYKVAAKEAMVKQGKTNEKDIWKNNNPDYFAAWSLIVAFFVLVFNFMLLETLATPVTMDQFAWSKSESLYYMGILMSIGAIASIATFASIGALSKKFSEVKITIWGGFLFMVIGRVLCIPFGGDLPLTYDSDFKVNLTVFCHDKLKNVSAPFLDYEILNQSLREHGRWLDLEATNRSYIRYMTLNCGEELVGCPSSQEWCSYIPAINLVQFIFGFIFTVFGYPVGVTLIQTLFSKLLGARPQGVWMGLMTGSGCLSRVMGPVFITYVYEEYGTIWTFGFTTVMMAVSLVWLLCFRKRLEPVDLESLAIPDRQMQDFTSVEIDEDDNEIKENFEDPPS